MTTLYFNAQATLDGFTYQLGVHEVDERLVSGLLEHFPNICSEIIVVGDSDNYMVTPEDLIATENGHADAPKVVVVDATDAAIRLADKHVVPIVAATGTGKDGRILVADVERLIDEMADVGD